MKCSVINIKHVRRVDWCHMHTTLLEGVNCSCGRSSYTCVYDRKAHLKSAKEEQLVLSAM